MTLDQEGRPVPAPLLRVSSLTVEQEHEIVVITLGDGRVLRASPGHPTADRADLGTLSPGDVLDGALVLRVWREAYTGLATWDLLPAGPTGVYWADDVLLGSTLLSP